uniref:ABC transporter domain-containing protein n=1 Tax=Caenorhabditis japonica TaxID=281687 RepID=A0A8R1I1A0_CAEJA
MTSHQRNQSRAKRHARVQQLLKRFGLKNCEHTPIGSQTITGLSRGEKKRLTIACELLTDPPVMFCDEPTTGLDSFTACEVMKCLKGLARDGKIVVCTIHQPATWVYQMADRLVLLCQGRVAYEGPDLQHYKYQCPLTILSLQQSSKLPKSPSLRSSRSENSRKTVRRSWLFQFQTLVARGLVQISRRKRYIAARLALTVLVSWFLGMVYLQVPIHKDHLLGIKGVVFAALQMNNILYMMPSLISFWEDYPVVVREYQSNMYSASAYFMARSLTDSILHLIFPIIFFNIIYFMIGLPVTFKAISTFLVMCVAMSMIITSLSHAVVSLCGDVTISMSVAPLISVPVMVFGGFLITVDAVPWYYKPLSYISWYHYAFEAIMTALFEDHGKIEGCSPNFTMFLPTQLNFECSTGLQFIKDQDFDVSNFWWDFGAVGLILAFWNVFGLVAFVCTVRRWS